MGAAPNERYPEEHFPGSQHWINDSCFWRVVLCRPAESDVKTGELSYRAAWTLARRSAPLAAACALYCTMALTAASTKSGTFDEYVHVTAGYSYWLFDDYRLNPENGNWPQRWVALPSLADRAVVPPLDQRAWQRSDMWTLSDQFFFGGGNDADRVLGRARFMVALVGGALALVVYFWSLALFGPAGGWISLVAFVFDPALLAHGALATSDVFAAAFVTAATWALWRTLNQPSLSRLIVSVLALAGAFLSKASSPILVLAAIGMLAVRVLWGPALAFEFRRRQVEPSSRRARVGIWIGLTAIHVVGVVLIVWASYGFRYGAMSPRFAAGDFIDPWRELMADSTTAARLVDWARDRQVFPESYLYGLLSVSEYARSRVAFLNGVVSTEGGWRWFFPYAALVKTTIPALVLLCAAGFVLVGWVWRAVRAADAAMRRRLYDLAPILLLIGVYGVFAILSPLNIGHRHLLPIIPAGIVLLGAGAELPIGRRARPVLLGSMLLWHAGESVHVAPDYLAYFNQLVGGPAKGYRHLVDSSLDWGQDLPGLKRWLDRNSLQGPSHPPVFLSYFGTSRPEHYGIDAVSLPGFPDRAPDRIPPPLEPGVYCISATQLQGLYLDEKPPWSAEQETKYQGVLHNLRLYQATDSKPAMRDALIRQTGEKFWRKTFRAWEQLRFARLAAVLRGREPDDQVGHSILIYRVGDQELSRALLGAPPGA
jgi:hypothetical protein